VARAMDDEHLRPVLPEADGNTSGRADDAHGGERSRPASTLPGIPPRCSISRRV
jgi:hypothetical protein